MANSDKSSKQEKPNHSGHVEFPDGKFAVYVHFTHAELRQIQDHCNGMRINMSRWIANLIKDELLLQQNYEDTEK